MRFLFKFNFFFLLIFFTLSKNAYSQEALIKNGDSWHYYDQGNLKDNWFNNLDFSKWKKGPTPIGYGDEQILTEIYFGEDENKKHVTKYFKKIININTDSFLAYEIRLLRDDGAVVYINGKELFKSNMPNSTINSSTLANRTIQSEDESIYEINIFDSKLFKDGENVISVSIHQAYQDSSDCIFSLELIGHTNPEVLAVLIDKKNKTNNDLEVKIKELSSKFEFEKVQLHNENLENANYNLKISLFLLGVLFIILLIACFFLIDNFRKKEKKQLIKIQFENDKSNQKDKEMITLTTNLLHNKQYFKEIKADLKGITTQDKATVKSIINQIDYVLDRDEDWEILKKHFSAVYEGFYDNIMKLHPTITETELRHCIFIKLHMQTKEIARILLIDPRSVQTARYRIKKKMNLNENEDLRQYLLEL